jgi:hypothetical protein
VNSYVATNDIAPQILWFNGPTSSAYCTARINLYGVGATPTFKIDGLLSQAGWSQTIVQNYINQRIAIPAYVDISPYIIGNASGGTVAYTITIEQDPGATGEVKIWSAIVEDHDVAGSAYGLYSGQELMWEPRAFPCGNALSRAPTRRRLPTQATTLSTPPP